MGNRFVGPIKRGEIESIEALKSRFKALAKASHPDSGGEGASAAAFAALRSEYEAALSDFHRHRFGLTASREGRNQARGQGSSQHGDLGGNPSHPGPRFSRPELYRRLRDFRRGGFPKQPRHEKERLRYEYRRYLVLALLESRAEEWRRRFESFEAGLLGGEDQAPGPSLALLDAILAWHGLGLEHERSGIILEFQGLVLDMDGGGAGVSGGRAARRLGEGLESHPHLGFLALLVEDLSAGPSLA